MAVTSFNNVPYVILFGGDTKSRQIIAVCIDLSPPDGSNSSVLLFQSRNKLKDNEVAVFDLKNNSWSVRLTEGVRKSS